MRRLASFDVTSGQTSPPTRLAVQIMFGLFCSAIMVLVRMLADIFAPQAGPFALIYPAVVVATLYGHWQAGMTAYIIGFFWAWRWVLQPIGSLEIGATSDFPRLIVNAISAAIVMLLAEVFRRAVAHATQDRDNEIAARKLAHDELEHRTKNNFSIVVSLLQLQQGKADGDLARLFDQAVTRIMCFAELYSFIPPGQQEGSTIAVQSYLTNLIERVTTAAFGPGVEVVVDIADVSFPRDTAAAMGLFVNEALTNCAKYAFGEGDQGRVSVGLMVADGGWALTVQDNGRGTKATVKSGSGLGSGSRIMRAFAQQAGATHALQIDEGGCAAHLAGKMV